MIHKTNIHDIALRPDNRSVVTLGSRYFTRDFPIREWHLDWTGAVAEIQLSERINAFQFSKDSNLVDTHTSTETQSWGLPQTREQISLARLRPVGIRGVAQQTNKMNRFSVAHIGNKVKVIDRAMGIIIRNIDFQNQLFAKAISGDGKWLTLTLGPPSSTRGGWELTAAIYSLQDQSSPRVFRYPEYKSDRYKNFLQFSADSRYFMTATRSLFRIWDIVTLKPVAELYQSSPEHIAVQLNGELAATTSTDGVIRVWRISDGLEIIRIENEDPVKKLNISPDGRWLATLHKKGYVRLWAVRPEDLIAQACARLSSPCP